MPILRFLHFNIRPRKDMKAIFDKVQFFSIIFFQHFREAHKNILIFRITFGNPYSRAKTDYYQLSPIRYFLPQNLTQHGKFSQILCIWGLVASHIFMWHINLFTFYKTFLARGNKNGTVLDLIVICEKKGRHH